MPVLSNHSTSKTILHYNINCFKMSFNMIEACRKRSFLAFPLLNLGILETKHKCTTLPSTGLAWIIKKESRLILANFCIIYLIYCELFQLSS